MKPSIPTIPDLYAEWLRAGWSMLESMIPGALVKDLPAKPAHTAAEQEWEGEGGALKSATSPSAGATHAQA